MMPSLLSQPWLVVVGCSLPVLLQLHTTSTVQAFAFSSSTIQHVSSSVSQSNNRFITHQQHRQQQRLSLSSSSSSSLVLQAHHQFNGGYDASNLAIRWSPLQAAEFVLWHNENDSDCTEIGQQLAPLIQHWSGTHLGEFLTRLYLGEKKPVTGSDSTRSCGELKLTFESQNVRHPQWKGLNSEEGFEALEDLLDAAVPDKVLEDPAEIARFAESFLLKEHTWPKVQTAQQEQEQEPSLPKQLPPQQAPIENAKVEEDTPEILAQQKLQKRLQALPTIALDEHFGGNTLDGDGDDASTKTDTIATFKRSNNKIPLERDSFASLGHAANMGKLLGRLRHARSGQSFTADHVLAMVVLPEQDAAKTEAQAGFLRLHDFFEHLGIRLTATDKIHVVQGMAKGGWGPAPIAKFVSNIPQLKEEEQERNDTNSVPMLKGGETTIELEHSSKKEESPDTESNTSSQNKEENVKDDNDGNQQKRLNLSMPSKFLEHAPAPNNNNNNSPTPSSPRGGNKHNGQTPPTPSWLP